MPRLLLAIFDALGNLDSFPMDGLALPNEPEQRGSHSVLKRRNGHDQEDVGARTLSADDGPWAHPRPDPPAHGIMRARPLFD